MVPTAHDIMEFYCAATAGNVTVVDRILDQLQQQGDDTQLSRVVTSQVFAGHSVLHGACSVNRREVVQALLRRPTVRQLLLNLPDMRQQRTPLQTCLAAGHSDLALLLLKDYHADAIMVDEDGRHALHLACYYNHPLVIRTLLPHMKPAAIHQPDHYGKTALLYAADHAHISVVQDLLEHYNTTTITPTIWQWEISHVKGLQSVTACQSTARLLMDAGLTVEPVLRCPKHAYKVHQDLYEWIQAAQDEPVQQVRTAAAQGNVKSLQRLLLQTEESLPLDQALHGAARYGHVSACIILLEAGASQWEVALQAAAQRGHLPVVQTILLHMGAAAASR